MLLLLPAHLVRILTVKKFINFNIELQLARDNGRERAHRLCSRPEPVAHRGPVLAALLARERPPSPLFTIFIAGLLSGARDNYTDPIEHTYAQLPINKLGLVLRFNYTNESRRFVSPWELSVYDDRMTVGLLRRRG
jgi:hypothetical protein